MALAAAFQELSTHLGTLQGRLIDLRLTIEVKPLRGDVVLVDILNDSAD